MTHAVIAALLLAQPPQPPARRPPDTLSAVIRGRVLRADGRPLPAARVSLFVTGVMERPPQLAETDVDGRYQFAELHAGKYIVSANKSGYMNLEFGQQRPFERGETITLADGEVRERVDLALPRHGAITGRVVDDAGDPVEGATLRVFERRYIRGRRSLVDAAGAFALPTNDQGRYRISRLQPGRYFVSASVGQIAAGRPVSDLPGYAPTYFPGTSNAAQAQVVTVGLSQEVPNVDFSLTPIKTARISGTAFGSDGGPVTGGLQLSPSLRSGAVATTMGARIDPGGKFEFPNLAPGEYVIQAFSTRGGYDEGELGTQFVAVNGTDVTDLVIRKSTGSTITGRVTVEGAGTIKPDDIEIKLFPVDFDLVPPSGQFARAEIFYDWTFKLAGINGPRRFHLLRAPPGWALKAVIVNGSDVTDAPLSFGTKDQSLTGVEVVITNRFGDVSGTVTGADGRPAGGSTVIVFAADRDRRYPVSRFFKVTGTAADGTFTVRGLPPGDYFAAALDRRPPADAADDDDWQDPDVLESIAAGAARVSLIEAQHATLKLKVVRAER